MPTADTEAPMNLQEALNKLGSSAPWCVLLDAAQEPPVLPAAQRAGLNTTSLYSGDFGRRLDEVAPHLAVLNPNSEFMAWLHQHWDGSYGILLQSAAPFEELRRHLKKFLMVKSPEGKTLRFRYYDPRVLRAFLPVCTPGELVAFFGPISRFIAAGRGGRDMLSFSLARPDLSTMRVPLKPAPAEAVASTPERGDLRIIALDAVLGTPIPGVAVVIEGPERRSAVTASEGRVVFDRLPFGAYRVYGIDGTRREGRGSAEFGPRSEPVFLLCQK